MPRRSPIWIAVIGNTIVVAATFAVLGWNSASAHAAARNTARFSLIWFVVGFAASGLARWFPGLPREDRLVQAFLGAHIVHFGTVALILMTFDAARVAGNPGRAAIVVLVGFGLTLTAGLTAAPRPSRLYTAAHTVALYGVFLLFFLAFVRNSYRPLRLLVLPLALALLLRVSSGPRFWKSQPAS